MTDETNYNDGKWHGWNGGDCPLHPKTVVDLRWDVGDPDNSVVVSDYTTDHWSRRDSSFIVAFRVIKEYREPREWWAVGTHMCTTKDEAEKRLAQLREDHPELGFDKWEVFCVVEKLP